MCLRNIFRITFTKGLLVVDNRLIGRRFWGNLGSFPLFGKIIFYSFQNLGKWESRMQWLNKFVRCTSGLLGSCLRHSFGIPRIPYAFRSLLISVNHLVLSFQGGLMSTASRRSWTLISTCRLWFSSHKSCGVNCFPKQSVVAFVFV
jgi:hypothetical protein